MFYMNKEPWSREAKIGAWALVIAVLTFAASFLIPEVRQFFHLEKPPEPAKVETQSKPVEFSQTPESASSQPPSPSKPSTQKQSTPGKKPAQTSTHAVKGNSNVTGNNVSGDHNITGNDNQAATVIAPNGIGVTGGTVTNPTVNNYINSAPPPRRLTKEERDALVSCLKTRTGTFIIGAIINNGEAYRYALDFSEVFSAAGWKNDWAAPVASFAISNGMFSGVKVTLPAITYDADTKQVTFLDPSPEVTAYKCFDQSKIAAAVLPATHEPSGTIRIDISEHP
jgi:hypothetical protein